MKDEDLFLLLSILEPNLALLDQVLQCVGYLEEWALPNDTSITRTKKTLILKFNCPTHMLMFYSSVPTAFSCCFLKKKHGYMVLSRI